MTRCTEKNLILGRVSHRGSHPHRTSWTHRDHLFALGIIVAQAVCPTMGQFCNPAATAPMPFETDLKQWLQQIFHNGNRSDERLKPDGATSRTVSIKYRS